MNLTMRSRFPEVSSFSFALRLVNIGRFGLLLSRAANEFMDLLAIGRQIHFLRDSVTGYGYWSHLEF
jgi:hypothetical protein